MLARPPSTTQRNPTETSPDCREAVHGGMTLLATGPGTNAPAPCRAASCQPNHFLIFGSDRAAQAPAVLPAAAPR
ncbi:hypothetical protein GCM10010140_61800 [Streptosporangium pseudovulgare]|uniref:Uncharacterized protein n=1 Tax=Streptosporangium pseudovulgare TaxID=35765 RepID=A0ABQ2RBX1_9ACTN|nr:hypothetical protein GCM10010140_61800 [Streptosporangium pseudovulgare]